MINLKLFGNRVGVPFYDRKEGKEASFTLTESGNSFATTAIQDNNMVLCIKLLHIYHGSDEKSYYLSFSFFLNFTIITVFHTFPFPGEWPV